MSQWTHVAGLIRLDSMGAVMVRLPFEEMVKMVKEAVVKALGDGPLGSEGPLRYEVYPNSDKDEHALSWGYIAIWGDLRDFGEEEYSSVLEWFQMSLERLMHPEGHGSPEDMSQNEKALYAIASFGIRDAILSVHAEYSPCKILLWDAEANKVIEVASIP